MNVTGLEWLCAGALLAWLWHMWAKRRQLACRQLLAQHLKPYQIERRMAQLSQAYMQALDEPQPQQRERLWQAQSQTEQLLAQEFAAVAQSFAKVPAVQARTLKWAAPGLSAVWAHSTFDTRRVMAVHAQALARAANAQQHATLQDKAFAMLAEMYLMQHSCHWFCHSRSTASARMWALHKTHHAQALAAVCPDTRQAYEAVVRG